MSTPHNEAQNGDIAELVLLPGDPLRAKMIAENFLSDAKCYNKVRGMLGFTGFYKGKRISVQGTGMGQPSISIYATELFNHYNVKKAIRIGTCGSFGNGVAVRDIVLAQAACTDSALNSRRFFGLHFAPIADFEMLKTAADICTAKKAKFHVGNILSSDSFYESNISEQKQWREYNVLACEMEAAELYTLAAKYRCKALAILTVSDEIGGDNELSADERQSSLIEMIEIALETAIAG